VQIRSTYRDRSTRDPHTVKHPDIYAKLASVTARIYKSRGVDYVRFEGCPVSVAEQVLALSTLAGSKNPILSASDSLRFNKAYLGWRAATTAHRLLGQRYQKAGPCPRGDAMPVLHEASHDAED
jgi:hypothetical protein